MTELLSGPNVRAPTRRLGSAYQERIAELEAAVDEAISASDNGGGSASDAIQDMLAILEAVHEPRTRYPRG